LPREPVTQEQLAEAWKLFADSMNQAGKRSLFATLTLYNPQLEGEQIHFKVANRVQDSDLKEIRAELMEFLRKRLQNFQLQLEVELAKSNEQKMKLLSEKDKYDKMVEKNPLLEELRKRLDLDLRQ
jgi:DNA polymerase-3 subunit gamma/tau